MREIRLSGSEGGGPESNRVSLPLFELRPSRARNGEEFFRSLSSPGALPQTRTLPILFQI